VTGRREAVIWMLMLLLRPKVDTCSNHRDQGITWCEKGDQRASQTHYFDLRGTWYFVSDFVCDVVQTKWVHFVTFQY
jgi:hypothetical protein